MNTSITMDVAAFIKVASDPARVIGLNTIGMTRNNISDDSITIIKKAFKLIYRKGYKLEDAIKKIENLENPIRPELQNFIDSIPGYDWLETGSSNLGEKVSSWINQKKIYINLLILVVGFYMKEDLHIIERETPKIKLII